MLLVMICSFAQAGDLELYISEDTLQLTYSRDVKLMEMEKNQLSFGFFFNEDRDIILNSGLMVPNLLKDKLPIPLSFSVGAKAYIALLTEPINQDVFALAPGAGARFVLPTLFQMPMYVDAEYFYAPSILTFGDAGKLSDFNARFQVDFLSRTTGFIGYRKLRFDLENTGDRDLDDAFHIGLRHSF
jgi:hypothetical protein